MNPIPDGRSLELYFIDGRPDGMLTAEVFNWTGHVLMTPRTRIGAALARREARYTGVYLLVGEQDGEPRAYSPSAAAAVILGRPANGTIEWQRADGSGTYKDWEAAQLGRSGESAP